MEADVKKWSILSKPSALYLGPTHIISIALFAAVSRTEGEVIPLAVKIWNSADGLWKRRPASCLTTPEISGNP